MKVWNFNSGKLIDSVKIKSIPQIALFNQKENGYLIFTEEGNILEKIFRHRELSQKFSGKNKFLDAILSHDKQNIISCDENSLKIKNLNENLKKYIYRLKKIEMCNYAVLVDLDTNR